MGRHAIIVIKKDNKYLQYYDKEWDSMLFLNCKLDNKNNLDLINEYLNDTLNINNFKINFIGEKTHTKYSESSKTYKDYIHDFYLIEIKQEFDIPNNYKYMTYDELINNKRIMETNSDIVSYIKEFNI